MKHYFGLLPAAVLLILLATSGECVIYEDCSIYGEMFSLKIGDCTALPCKLIIGSKEKITVEFKPKVNSDVLTEKVYFVISDVEQETQIHPNACNALEGKSCPLNQGEVINYKAELVVGKDKPPVKADLIWLLKNELEQVIACFATEVRLEYGFKEGEIEKAGIEDENVKDGDAEIEYSSRVKYIHPSQRKFREPRA